MHFLQLVELLQTMQTQPRKMLIDFSTISPKVAQAVAAAAKAKGLKSSGRNWALELYNPCPGVMENVPSSKGYAGGFGVDLMLKDLGLAVENAENLEANIPLGKLARHLYESHSKAGNGQLDFSSVFNLKKTD